jgi:hypothetical protein
LTLPFSFRLYPISTLLTKEEEEEKHKMAKLIVSMSLVRGRVGNGSKGKVYIECAIFTHTSRTQIEEDYQQSAIVIAAAAYVYILFAYNTLNDFLFIKAKSDSSN